MLVSEPRSRQPATADEAIDVLYRAHATRAVRLAYVISGDVAVAEEIAQEAFVRTWRAWDRLRETDAAYAYLRTTVVNLSRSMLRRRAVEFRHRIGRREEGVEVDVPGRVDIVRAMLRLPPRQRACV